jgi:hypothetical protein
VHGDDHAGRNIRRRRVDEIAVNFAELFRIIAAISNSLPVSRVAQHGNADFVELQIR